VPDGVGSVWSPIGVMGEIFSISARLSARRQCEVRVG